MLELDGGLVPLPLDYQIRAPETEIPILQLPGSCGEAILAYRKVLLW